jgi:hypothetical protein
MSTIEDLKAHTSSFFELYWPDGESPPTWSSRFDLTCPEKAKEYWPNTNSAGVYALLDAAETVLYLGKSSMKSSVGHRIAAHVGAGGAPQLPGTKLENVRWVRTIGLPDNHRWLSPALEEYLIAKLVGLLNKVGASLDQ